jgi:alpha-L-rhamnosidase
LLLLAALVCLGRPGSLAGEGMAKNALSDVEAKSLRCEYLANPRGLDATAPRLSWMLTSRRRSVMQSAYQILVASSQELLDDEKGDLWDSGKVCSDESCQIAYSGKCLESRQSCFWKVRSWDEQGRPTAWSDSAYWQMGLLAPSDWQAQWIAARPPFSAASSNPPPQILRRSFSLAAPIRSATLYVTALGLYEVHLNGQRVGNNVLAPDWTDYRRRVRYQAFDVSALLRRGDNAIAALLADGWYCGHIGNAGFRFFGRSPAFLAQLEVTLADGQTQIIASDGSWKTHASPILASDFMWCEDYDARLEIAGWDRPGLDEGSWTPAETRSQPGLSLDGQVTEPVRQICELRPKTMTEPKPRCWIFDLGQNIAGVARLKVSAPAGTTVSIRHAEALNPDGTLYTRNLRLAFSTDHYTCKGAGLEIWQPRFTFHGFRYVELSGLAAQPLPDAVTGVVLSSDTARTGKFSCSDARLNQLEANIQWTQRANFLSVPTDCPQRDERLGWMGDAQLFMRTAAYDADIAAFFSKWLTDADDGQSPGGAFGDVSPNTMKTSGTPGWADAGVICPWTLYQVYGDKRVLERHLPAMIKWLEFCRQHSDQWIRTRDRGCDAGDWLAIGADTPKDLIGTAFFAYSTRVVAMACEALGKLPEAQQYERQFQDIRAAFNARYVGPDGRILSDTQTAYALALKFDLLPENLRSRAAGYLAKNVRANGGHLSTGFLGTACLLPVLTDFGKADTAYGLLLQDTFPSWLFPVKQGATTIWERWDGWTPEKGFQRWQMNSLNHYALGSCGEYLFGYIGGIRPAAPGFKSILVRPVIRPGLSWARTSYDSIHGRIATLWSREADQLTLEVNIPANTTARVCVPAKTPTTVTEGGRAPAQAPGVKVLGPEQGMAIFEVGSGTYRFTSNM